MFANPACPCPPAVYTDTVQNCIGENCYACVVQCELLWEDVFHALDMFLACLAFNLISLWYILSIKDQ